MPGVASLQTANPSMGTVTRQPQTTTTPVANIASVPFARLSRPMQIPGPQQAGLAFGNLWTPTLRAVGGYLAFFRIDFAAVGGSGTGAVLSADGPYNAVQNFMFRDPFGQPVYQSDGFGMYLIQLYSGQVGMLAFGNKVDSLPSWTTVAANGNFQFSLTVPLQLDSSGYGSLSLMNNAAQPNVQLQTNPSGTVYSTPPSVTVPTLTLSSAEMFWGAPIDHPEIAPADVGSSGQWIQTNAQGNVASAVFQKLQLNVVGTWIHTLILVLRDSTGARVNSWPLSDLTLWADGVPILQETLNQRLDKMYTQFGVAAPTGVIVYTFRDSVQSAVSTADTYDVLLPTSPATVLEVSGTFQTISNAPARVVCYVGQLYPKGGIPYTHLAQ